MDSDKIYNELIEKGVSRNIAKAKSSVFFVEANTYERHNLWKEHHDSIPWEQDNEGFLENAGELTIVSNKKKKVSVWVSFWFVKIYNTRICFYEATSSVVDHDMVKEFIVNNYLTPSILSSSSKRMFYAEDFSECINECKE